MSEETERLNKIQGDLSRVTKYLADTGYWFASCPEFEGLAQQAVEAGILQPAANIAPFPEAKHFYIRAQLVGFYELPVALYNLFEHSWRIQNAW